MGFLIAVTGKGGVGKTTLSALLVRRLIASGRKPVLAVDADPNTNLDMLLGVQARATLGGIREEARELASSGKVQGVSKTEFLEMKIAESLVEAEDFDFLAMGRPEGPGCYCYANNVLKTALGAVARSYPWIVVDNEAGLENLSRRIVVKADLLVYATDTSLRGLATVRRLSGMTAEMGVSAAATALLVNRVRPGTPLEPFGSLAAGLGARLLTMPDDQEMAALNERGGRVSELPAANPCVRAVDAFLAFLPAVPDTAAAAKAAAPLSSPALSATP